MDEVELQFYADNYCPAEIYENRHETFKTCGIQKINNDDKESTCLECWRKVVRK